MRLPQNASSSPLTLLWTCAVLVSATPLVLSGAEGLGLNAAKRKPSRAPIYFSDPKATADLPGPDQVEAPPSPFINSLKPKTSEDSFVASPVPIRGNSRHLSDVQRDWLLGPVPTSQQERDTEINKVFGIRDDSYEQTEKSRQRSEWLDRSQPRQNRQPTRGRSPEESDSESQRGDRRASLGDRRDDPSRLGDRSGTTFNGLFGAGASDYRDTSSSAALFGQNPLSWRDAANSAVNPNRDREASMEGFRKLLEPHRANSAFGTAQPLATSLDSPQPVSPTPVPIPALGGSDNDLRRNPLDSAELSGASTRYRAPLFEDLNRRQFGVRDPLPDDKAKSESAHSWSQPPNLTIPRRKFP